MFNVDFLNLLRLTELDLLTPDLRPGTRILEFGAGTGAQAKALTDRGYDVVAVDLATSGYAQSRVYPIIDYDGRRIPLPDASIDVVFSSNVLQSVVDLPALSAEFRRILKPTGYCLHVMPSSAWRAWTTVAGWPTAIIGTAKLANDLISPPAGVSRAKVTLKNLKTVAGAALPIGHTSPDAISELWSFSARCWKRRFVKHGFEVLKSRSLGIFHTGHMLLGPKLQIQHRLKVSRVLGSAANVFIVRPAQDETASGPGAGAHGNS